MSQPAMCQLFVVFNILAKIPIFVSSLHNKSYKIGLLSSHYRYEFEARAAK